MMYDMKNSTIWKFFAKMFQRSNTLGAPPPGYIDLPDEEVSKIMPTVRMRMDEVWNTNRSLEYKRYQTYSRVLKDYPDLNPSVLNLAIAVDECSRL